MKGLPGNHRTVVEFNPLLGYHARCETCGWLTALGDNTQNGYQLHSNAARDHRIGCRRLQRVLSPSDANGTM